MTGSWSPSRLVLARQRRGLTQSELGQKADVARESIVRYESGLMTPSEDTVNRLAYYLAFPAAFFFAGEVELLDVTKFGNRRELSRQVSFRAMRSLTTKARLRALAAGALAIELAKSLEHRFGTPPPSVPDLGDEGPEDAAAMLRREWRLPRGPLPNMVHLAEWKGARVFWLAEDTRAVDAFCFWEGERPIILLNAQKGGARGRFDIAHELAHAVLHRRRPDHQGDDLEREADGFAGAFLLDADTFAKECPRTANPRDYLPLRARWRVSIQAMVHRARDLDLLSPWKYRSACIELSKLGWRVQEEGEFPQEESKLFTKAELLLRRRGHSLASWVESLDHPADMVALIPLHNLERQPRVVSPTPRRHGSTQLQLVWDAERDGADEPK